MQPRPMAETSRPAFPSFRVCISTVRYFQATGHRASCDIPILRSYCLILAKVGTAYGPGDKLPAILQKRAIIMAAEHTSVGTHGRRNELRTELARKVASFVGAAESRKADVPGLTIYRHTAPTAPAPATYEPSVALVVQGRKQVELGATTFIYDPSRYLLTSLDLPVVSRVVEAT